MNEREIRIPQAPMIKPVQVQQTSAQLTPDYLDSIINNTNEHPQVRKQASEMKKNLFSKQVEQEAEPKKIINKPITVQRELSEEDFLSEVPTNTVSIPALTEVRESEKEVKAIPIITPTIKPAPKVNPSLEIRGVENQEFDSFLSEFRNNLFNDEFSTLSNPSIKLQLRSMTVSEYKFLTKQFEVYQRSLENLDKNNPEISREIDLRESILTNAIDNVLQRCITNNVRVYDLTIFDWIYAMIALRAISRGTERNLRITCSNKKCNQEIRLGILEVMKALENNREKFIVNPINIIPINESISVYLGIPTRGDLVEAQKIFMGDKETSLSFVSSSMYIRAYIQNQTTANLLTPIQRFNFIDVLQYDIIKKIKDSVNANLNSFYSCFGEIKCEACGKITEVDVSDFILFFYDF